MGKVIGFFSAAGGVGKTTISLILGYFLKLDNKKVLMVDMDPSVCLSLYLLDEDKLVDSVDKGRTISNLVEKVSGGKSFDLNDFILEGRLGEVYLDLMVADSRLSEVIDRLWFGAKAGREYLLSRVLRDTGLTERYDFVVLDTIPFYDKKYTLLTIYASDSYVIPLRPTLVDTHRTQNMLRELPAIASMDEGVIYRRSSLIFNLLKGETQEREISDKYRDLFLRRFPGIYVFQNYLKNLISFSRFGTEEERRGKGEDDRRKVKENFEPVFEEFKRVLGA